ncbi:SRPBCC domain-containing protein [Neobacillus niacini]|uniref:SRPBCC domain-containing protein n=1 Tax=Neobacillus niacini TaxID=86668 RepID=UPI0021CB3DF7|nr:SRPBCC domain-containing protein [Neobacillus niacini]MCM3767687.1 SRPBCC domain-containing protein [Neobacillus niacini]
MKNVTKFTILKPANEVFEAFVDPANIGNFWFSSSSERWDQGKTVTLRYDEYNAVLDIKVVEVEVNRKIAFLWGPPEDEHQVTITITETGQEASIIEVVEERFDENDPELTFKLVDNKEGWVYMLTCLKGYLEFGITTLRKGMMKDL